VVIDTTPDFREQMITAGVTRLDAAVFTHAHADHIHGIDDLRGFVLVQRHRIPVYADEITLERLTSAFTYCFETPAGSNYPPIVKAVSIKTGNDFEIEGEGGSILFQPLEQIHGDIHSLAFRIGNFAYCTDVSGFPPETIARMQGLDAIVIDALQYRAHPSHFSLEQALEWIGRLDPKKAYLTHMHTPLDYETVMRETPDNVYPSYDGLQIEL
jgi:phosphoribosyl 1,2-cyclic phosphate phosphodiesterase